MAISEDRDQRLSDLAKAAVGIGAATAFFTRTDLGKELTTNGLKTVRYALKNTSEVMQDKTIKSMWGHGKVDLSMAANTFKESLLKGPGTDRKLPVTQKNLLGAMQRISNLSRNENTIITSLFNKDVMMNRLRSAMNDIVPTKGLSERDLLIRDRDINQVAEDLLFNRTKHIISENDEKIPRFSDKMMYQIQSRFKGYGDAVTDALKTELSQFEDLRKEFAHSSGKLQFDAIQNALQQYDTYATRFRSSFFNKKLSGTKAATVNDVLAHKDLFAKQFLKGGKTEFTYLDMLEDMVKTDSRFGDLVVDEALRYDKGKFLDYSDARAVKEKFENTVIENAGRILKPLEVMRNKRNSPDFLLMAKGTLDPFLENSQKGLSKNYVRLFDKTYSLDESGLVHIPEADNTYLTPGHGFEGNMTRQMLGNTDFALEEQTGILEKLSINKRYGLSRGQKKSIKRESNNLLSSYDKMIISLNGALKEGIDSSDYAISGHTALREVIEDVNDEVSAPNKEVIREMIINTLNDTESFDYSSPGARKGLDNLRLIAGNNEKIMEYLETTGDLKGANNTDLRDMIRQYRKDPLAAVNRRYKHGDDYNDFFDEVRIELFKNASLTWSTTDTNSDAFINFMNKINQSVGTNAQEWHNMNLMMLQAYMQKKGHISLKSPDIVSESFIKDRGQIESVLKLFYPDEMRSDFQEIIRPISESKKAGRHLDSLESLNLIDTASIAMRPNQYIHMRKAFNPLDIIEDINDGNKVIKTIKQFGAGRNSMDSITTASLYPYFSLFRLSNDLKQGNLNFDRQDTGNAFDLAKGFALKRALPVYGALFGLNYLNYESNNLFGRSFSAMAAQSAARFDLGMRNVADIASNQLKDAYYWFTPLNYMMEDPYQTAEERKEWYESGYSPVKGNRFWSLGDSEYFGGKITYYQPNYVRRSEVNWRDIGIYGSEEEKWKHSIIPTPRHPLSTVRYLLNPYWLEEKHKFDRPYMVSGSMFDPNTPWGSLGNATIGRFIKPSKPLNRDRITSTGVDVRSIIEHENERIREMDREKQTFMSIKSTDTAIETTSYGGGSSGGSGIGYSNSPLMRGSSLQNDSSGMMGYVLHQDRLYTSPKSALNLLDRIQIGVSSVGLTRERVLNQIESINYAIKEKAKWSYNNDVGYAKEIQNATATNIMDTIRDRDVRADLRNLDSTTDMIRDISYSVAQMSGIYNFLGRTFLPPTKSYAYARSSDMTSASDQFWETGIGGANPNNIMEIARRFIPHEDRNRIRINPLRNNMPDWLPDRFQNGDPYKSIKKGEMRLPGAGYEALYGIEDYMDMSIGPSALGKSVEEIMDTMIGSKAGVSQRLLDSADEGTAIHKEYEQMLKASGLALITEGEINDEENNIRGFYDVMLRDDTAKEGRAIMDIKTVSDSVFNQIQSGAKYEHLAQVNYYLGMTNLSKGYVFYINRDNPEETLSYDINFSQRIYKDSLDKVYKARAEMTKRIEKGALSPYAFYDDFTRFKILADVAPGSTEYKQYKALVSQGLTDGQRKEYDATLKRVERQSQSHRFFNYKFVGVNMDKRRGVIESVSKDGIRLVGDDTVYNLAGLKPHQDKVNQYLTPGMNVTMEYQKNYQKSKYIQAAIYNNGTNINRQMMRQGAADRNDDGSVMATRAMLTKNQIMIGKPFEVLAHLPIPYIHNKFMRVDTPYESWLKENVYGKKFTSWSQPIDTMIKPAFQQAWGASYWQGILGAGLFALDHYIADTAASKGAKLGTRLGSLAFTPGLLVGEIAERVATLNFNPKKATSGKLGNLGAAIGLTGFAIHHSNNPFFSVPAGGILGYAAADFLESGLGKRGAMIGMASGLLLTALKTDFQFSKMDQRYVPSETKKRWDLEEYFDRLEYIKYKGLYEKTARLALDEENVNIDAILDHLAYKEEHADEEIEKLMRAKSHIQRSSLSGDRKAELTEKIDKEINSYANPNIDVPNTPYTRLAMGYHQAMESTVYALDESSSWSQILRSLEPYERDYFLEFANEQNPRKRDEILEVISPYKRKILENLWGMKPTKQKGNHAYFKKRKLPGMAWEGWEAQNNLDSYKVKTIMNEGMLLSDFGYYDSERDKPEVRNATPVAYHKGTSPLVLQLNLLTALNGLGITDSQVSVLPSQQSGIQTFLNLATINTQRFKSAITRI